MGCPYCTPMTDEDTGESLEFCKGFHDVAHMGDYKQETRLHLVCDRDDGSWSMVILLADEWLSKFIHDLGEPAEHAGTICTVVEAPPHCPWCGRRLHERGDA